MEVHNGVVRVLLRPKDPLPRFVCAEFQGHADPKEDSQT